MSKRNPKLLIQDIIESIKKIQVYTENMDYDTFLHDERTHDAVIRNIEIIGEAANRIPEYIKESSPNIEWHKIIAVRNRAIHEYFGVDYRIIWMIIQQYLPILQADLLIVLSNLT